MDWENYVVSIAKVASNQTGGLICLTKFFLLRLFLYLYSSIQIYMECYSHTWASSPTYYLDMLNYICCVTRTVGSLSKYVHFLVCFTGMILEDLEDFELTGFIVSFPHSLGSFIYFDCLCVFFVVIDKFCKDFYFNNFFSGATAFWNHLFAKCFVLWSKGLQI